MTKYTQSMHKLAALINEIFRVHGISVDTKAIVLVLAATLPSKRFIRWLDPIKQLNHLHLAYKEINVLRHQFGHVFRDFIILSALQTVDHDVSSDELQLFISTEKNLAQEHDSGQPSEQNQEQQTATELPLALTEDLLNLSVLIVGDGQLTKVAREQLIAKCGVSERPNINMVLETYLCCRTKASPTAAASAVFQAIITILTASNMELNLATIEAKRLMRYALAPFTRKACGIFLNYAH